MPGEALTPVCDTSGAVLAFADESNIWFPPEIDALEEDHPRWRFAAMLALAAVIMQRGPDAERYDPAVAAFYARYVLIPNTDFILHRDRDSDAELAERFNVPLEQIAAKHLDLAMLDANEAA